MGTTDYGDKTLAENSISASFARNANRFGD